MDTKKKVNQDFEYSAITASLIGVIKDKNVTEEDYRSFLEKKHLNKYGAFKERK